jgi:hypothetical protein
MNAPRTGWWEFALKVIVVLWAIATLALAVRVAHGQDVVRDPIPNPNRVGSVDSERPWFRVTPRPPERRGVTNHVLVYGVSWCSNCCGLMDELRRNAELRTVDSHGTECVRVHGVWFWLYVVDEARWDGYERPAEVPEICYQDPQGREFDKAVGYNPGDREAFISIVSRAKANPRREQ